MIYRNKEKVLGVVLFRFNLIRGDIKGGFPLSMRQKRGEGSAPTDSTDITNRGKDKQPPPQPPPNRATSYQAGQKVKKLHKKIFFLQIDSKKNQFSIGGYSTYNI